MECIQSRTLMLVIIAVTDKITVLIKSNITAGTKLIRFSLANTGLPCIEIRSYLEWCVSQKYILWTITRRLLRTIYGYDRIYFMIGRNRAPYNGTPSLIFLLPSPHHFNRIPPYNGTPILSFLLFNLHAIWTMIPIIVIQFIQSRTLCPTGKIGRSAIYIAGLIYGSGIMTAFISRGIWRTYGR